MIHFHNIFPSKLEIDLHHNYGTLSQETNNFVGPKWYVIWYLGR